MNNKYLQQSNSIVEDIYFFEELALIFSFNFWFQTRRAFILHMAHVKIPRRLLCQSNKRLLHSWSEVIGL